MAAPKEIQQLVEKFKLFLKSNNFLPLSKWSSFQLDHGDPTIAKENYLKIKKEVGKKNGIYIYKKGEQVLYIGKGNPLFDRLKSHNRESFEPVPGDTKDNMWHRFFSKNTGRVKIYWKEVEAKKENEILEKVLEYLIPTEFMAFKNKK